MAALLRVVPTAEELDEETALEMCRLIEQLTEGGLAPEVRIRARAMIDAGIAVLQTIDGFESVRLVLDRHAWQLRRRQELAREIGATS